MALHSTVLSRGLPIGRVAATRGWFPVSILVFVILNRAALLLAAICATIFLPVKIGTAGAWPGGPTGLVTAVLSRWDGRWYFSIAHDGYQYLPGHETNVAFTPLLPLFTHIVGVLTGQSDVDGLLSISVLISNVALLAALFFLARIVARRWGTSVAARTVLCLVLFPTSFFLSAAYPESLFLAFALAAFATAEKRHWWAAGVLAAIAALARVYGVLIIIPLAWMYVEQHGRRLRPDIVWLGLIPAALLSWLAYLYVLSGDPLVLLHAEAAWGHSLLSSQMTPGFLVHLAIDSSVMLAFGALVVLGWRRFGLSSYAIFATVFYLPILYGYAEGYGSATRYVLELFPAFIVLGQLTRRRAVLAAYVVVAGLGSLVGMTQFAIGAWAG